MTATEREEFFASLDDPLCTLKGRLKEAAERMYLNVRDSFPPERAAEAERVARQFVSDAHDLLCRDDRQSAQNLIGEFAQQMTRLSRLAPAPTPDGEISRVWRTLLNPLQWNELEIDFLRAWLKPGERLTLFDRWSAQTDTGRKTTREQLREAMRPRTWTRRDTWDRQFGPIPERE